MIFAARIVARELGSKSFLSSPAGRFVLAGGASEVGGTPKRPKDLRKRIEWEVVQNVPLRIPILESAAAWDVGVGWNVPLLSDSHEVFLAGKGFFARSKYRSPKTREQDGPRVRRLENWFRKRGIPVLHVLPPSRLRPSDPMFSNVFDFTEEQHAILAAASASNGVPVLDLALEAERDGLDPRTMFFATDHHFNGETAHWAATAIAARLADLGFAKGFGPDPPAGSAWSETPAVPFLGFMGKKKTRIPCQPDSISFPQLSSPGSYSFDREDFRGRRTHAEGDFSILLDRGKASGTGSLYRDNPYDAFSHGSGRFVSIRNNDLPDAPRILFFADSFDNAILVFLAARCAEVASVDGRNGDVDLSAVVREGRFDAAVLLSYNPPNSRQLSCLDPAK